MLNNDMQSSKTGQKHNSTRPLLVIDMMSAQGHLTLNNFYLRNLAGLNIILYISANFHSAFSGIKVKALGKTPCKSGLIRRFVLALKVIAILVTKRPEKAIFLSYDLATFPVISRISSLMGTDIVCFEHNTAPKTWLQRIFHRLMPKGVHRLVYAKHILELYKQTGVAATYVPHPCVPPEGAQSNGNEWRDIISASEGEFKEIALCPSASVDFKVVETTAREMRNTLFICKGHQSSDLENVLCHAYFAEYAEALKRCGFVAAFFTLDDKVSGPPFEAIAAGKPVMVLRNAFGQHLKDLFGDMVFYSGEPIPQKVKTTKIIEHNQIIIEQITEIVVGKHTNALN